MVGAIFLFAWGAVLHSMTPLDLQGLHEFKDNAAVVAALKATTDGNGIYFGPQGVWLAISFRPDMTDKTQNLTPLLIREVLTDLASAFLLCLLLLAVRCRAALARGGVFAVAALAAGMENQVSDWNWYGFSAPFTVFELVDIVGSWFVLGVILSLLKDKIAPEA
jgi:hypothetical protein